MSAQTQNTHKTGHSAWYEIPVSDLDAGKAFYEAVLNIELIKTEDPSSPNPMVFFNDPADNGSYGHLCPGKPAPAGTGNTIHMIVNESLEDVMPRVEKAGGQIVSPIIPIPAGRFVYMTDPDGNSIGLFNWA